MIPQVLVKQLNRRQILDARRTRLSAVVFLAILVVAGGMTGANCVLTTPPADGGNNTSSSGAGGPVVLNDDHVLGDPSASLTVVEYSDFECAQCGRFARSEFPTLEEQYIDTGKIRWLFRHFPLDSHDDAEAAAIAAECAHDQDAFLEYRDLVYATTDSDAQMILTDEKLREHAATLGLDTSTFDACLAGESQDTRVQRDANSGTALNVSTIPAFFVGSELVSGFQTAEQLSRIIERHLSSLDGS